MTIPEFSAELKALFVQHELTVGYSRTSEPAWVCFVGVEIGIGGTPEEAIQEALEAKGEA